MAFSAMRTSSHSGSAANSSVVGSADARPTVQARELAELYFYQIDLALDSLSATLEEGLTDLNDRIVAAGIPAVMVR